MNKKGKKILIAGLFIFMLILFTAYGVFNANLNIDGTASISSKWDIHIRSIIADNIIGNAKSLSASVGDSGLSATFEANLISPKDSITYKVIIINDGTIDAKLSDINFYQSQSGDNAAIKYSYSGVDINDKLASGNTAELQITVTFTGDSAEEVDDDFENQLKLILSYVQDK